MNRPPENDDEPTQLSLGLLGAVYGILLLGSVGWLWCRDRLFLLQAQAFGERGPWLAAVAGLGVGLLGAAIVAGASRRLPPLRAAEQRIAALLPPLTDTTLLGLALLTAIVEEIAFRLALQDAVGLPTAVAIYALLNTGPGFLALLPVAALSGLVFGLLLDNGFGLLGATTAHALINYLTLQRIPSP